MICSSYSVGHRCPYGITGEQVPPSSPWPRYLDFLRLRDNALVSQLTRARVAFDHFHAIELPIAPVDNVRLGAHRRTTQARRTTRAQWTKTDDYRDGNASVSARQPSSELV